MRRVRPGFYDFLHGENPIVVVAVDNVDVAN
jgi:hypothetical protein